MNFKRSIALINTFVLGFSLENTITDGYISMNDALIKIDFEIENLEESMEKYEYERNCAFFDIKKVKDSYLEIKKIYAGIEKEIE